MAVLYIMDTCLRSDYIGPRRMDAYEDHSANNVSPEHGFCTIKYLLQVSGVLRPTLDIGELTCK